MKIVLQCKFMELYNLFIMPTSFNAGALISDDAVYLSVCHVHRAENREA